jgi:hypothetical protein
MPGYLDQYGAGEERRNRIIAICIVSALTLAVISALTWYLLKNHHQEAVVKTFLADLRKGDYPAAYRDWGCTRQKPCSGYTMDKFVEDWGPKSSPPDPAVLGLTESESCNQGVLLSINVNKDRTEKLWVDRSGDAISFAPFPICPHKTPFEIMIHRTLGQLRKPLLH